MRHFFLCLAGILLNSVINAQLFYDAYYSKGIIITNTDTIRGYVDCGMEGFVHKIKYKLDLNDKKAQSVLLSEVNYLETTIAKFDRVTLNGTSALMERLHKGEVSLYKNISSKSGAPLYNASTGTFMGGGSYKKELLYLIKDSEVIKIKKKKLKSALRTMMADNSEIMSDIEKLDLKGYSLEFNLKTLISKYNHWHKNHYNQ